MYRHVLVVSALTLLNVGCLLEDPDVSFPVNVVVDGPGSVVVQPVNRTCDTTCTVYVKPGNELFFEAIPDVANGFRQWDQPECTTNECSLVVNGPRSIVAEFYERGDALWASTLSDVTPPLPHLNLFSEAGAVRIVGQFDGELDLGDGPVSGAYNANLFTGFMDEDGAATGAVVLASADLIYAQADRATNGDLLVGGWFEGSADLGDGVRTSGTPGSLFIARYTTAGAATWVFQFDSVDMELLDHVGVHATSDDGMVLRANFLGGSFDLGGGTLSEGVFGESTVVARFDTNGAHVWSQTLGDAVSDNIVSTLDGDDVVLAGNYAGDLDLNGATISATADGHVFIARLSGADGTHIDSDTFFGAGETDIRSIQMTPEGDLLVSAFVGGSVNFGSGTLVNQGDPYAPAIARFSGTDLSEMFSTVSSGTGFGVFHQLRYVDAGTRILATGVVGNSLVFGETSVNSVGFSDVLVAEMDAATGDILFVRTYGGENADAGYQSFQLPGGDAIVFGAFRNSTEFDSIDLSGDDLTVFAGRLLQFAP